MNKKQVTASVEEPVRYLSLSSIMSYRFCKIERAIDMTSLSRFNE